jgi:hypothetical protein
MTVDGRKVDDCIPREASPRRFRDRILHEALSVGPDPLHLTLVFNLSHTAASRYADIAQHLLDGRLEQPAER